MWCGETSAAPSKHETVRWVRRNGKTLLEETSPGYLHGRGEKAGVIGYDGYFYVVIAHLIKDPLLKLYKYIRILFKSGIQVSNMVLWLRSGAVDPLDDLSPFLLKVDGLSSTSITLEKG